MHKYTIIYCLHRVRRIFPFPSVGCIHYFPLENRPVIRYNVACKPQNEFYTENDYLYDYEKK